MVRTKCASCKFGNWVMSNKTCGTCIGYNKWKPEVKPRPKPTYVGHRSDE